MNRSPYEDVLHRLRGVERACRRHEDRLNLDTFGVLGAVLGQLAEAFERSHEPLEWLVIVSTVTRRSAEALVLRRARKATPRTRGR